MARPRKTVDKETFEKLCEMQCTILEVCAFFEMCPDTIEKWCKETYQRSFSKVFAEKRLAGCASLRRKQFRLADKSAAMAIFLGKQYLGQKDDKSDDIPVTFRIKLDYGDSEPDNDANDDE